MKNTKIEWCDHTFNPWIGCTAVSAGCANCYAAALDRRWGKDRFGKGKPRTRTSAAYWRQPIKWNEEHERRMEVLTPGMARVDYPLPRPRVFCASLADWLDVEVPIEWLADLMALIQATPNLDWLLLTKRPENWLYRLSSASLCDHNGRNEEYGRNCGGWMQAWLDGQAPSNVWVGATVENQDMAERRIHELLRIPAKVRFLSCEPLLGPVELGLWTDYQNPIHSGRDQRIHWVICGGESGPHARPMNPDWARSLRDQCKAAGVPFFMKQIGGKRKPFEEIPNDLDLKEFPVL